jgi:hypothetical protein
VPDEDRVVQVESPDHLVHLPDPDRVVVDRRVVDRAVGPAVADEVQVDHPVPVGECVEGRAQVAVVESQAAVQHEDRPAGADLGDERLADGGRDGGAHRDAS